MRLSLIGFKGVGKTTLGIKLSALMGIPFWDMDHLMLRNTNHTTISDMYQHIGERAFRQKEIEIINHFEPEGNYLLATGGGVIVHDATMQRLKSMGSVIYLAESFYTFVHRMQILKPRFGYDILSLNEMWNDRAPLYMHYADLIIDAEKTPIEDMREMLEGLHGSK